MLISMLIYGLFAANDDVEKSKSIQIIEIDNCEYVQMGVGYDRWGAHKGNCKFCAERQRTKMHIESMIENSDTRIDVKPFSMQETGSFNFVIEDTTESESFWIGSRDKLKTNGKYATGF